MATRKSMQFEDRTIHYPQEMTEQEVLEQFTEALPSICKECGEPIYWEKKNGNWLPPRDAFTLVRHYCSLGVAND